MKKKALSQIISSDQILEARKLLGWNSSELARQSGLSVSAICRAQEPSYQSTPRPATLSKIRDAFERSGIVFSAREVKITRNI